MAPPLPGEVVPGELLLERDRALLSEAWGYFARLPFEKVDVLVLREMGKQNLWRWHGPQRHRAIRR